MAVVAVDAHVVGAGTVNHVEDDVWFLGDTGSTDGRSSPEGDGPWSIRFRFQRQGDVLARQVGQIDAVLCPFLRVCMGSLEKSLVRFGSSRFHPGRRRGNRRAIRPARDPVYRPPEYERDTQSSPACE